MIVGAVLVMIGVAATKLPVVVVGGVIGGLGFRASYSGSLRTISPLAEPDQRAGLFAALFTVAYLAFGVPVIIAGQLIPRAGLFSTVIGYCVVTVVVATAGLVAQSVVARRGSAKAPMPRPDENGTFVPGWPGCLPQREANYPPVRYIPLVDIDRSLLTSSNLRTYCPYKGDAPYYSIVRDQERGSDAVWFYDQPYPAVAEIKGRSTQTAST